MKPFRVLASTAAALCCLVLAHPSPSMAGQMLLGVTGGMGLPMGDFGDLYNGGVHLGLSGDYLPVNELGIGFDFSYTHHNMKDDPLSLAEAIVSSQAGFDVNLEDTATILQYGLHARWFPPVTGSSLAPYLEGGVGMYNLKEEMKASAMGQSFTESFSDNKVGIHGGVGLNFKTGPMYQVGVGASFHNVFTEGSSTTYMTLGVNLALLSGIR